MTIDRHIVRRVSEEQIDLFVTQQQAIVIGVSGITTDQAVPPEQPDIPLDTDGNASGGWHRIIGWVTALGPSFLSFVQIDVALGQAEAFKLDIELPINAVLEFDRQGVFVPAGVQCQLVVGQDIGFALGLRQVRQCDGRDRGKA